MSTELATTQPPVTALAARPEHADDRHVLQPRSLAEAIKFSEMIAGTPFAPKSSAHEVFAMIASGRELGLTAMQSLKAYHMIQGTPSLSADGMVAIVLASGLCERWDVLETTAERCTIVTRRRGKADASKTWLAADAKRAQLTTPMWSKYPAQMLRHRTATDLARQEFPDVVLGNYTADEITGGLVAALDDETAPPSRDGKPSPLDAFRGELAEARALNDVREAWKEHSRYLHDADQTDAADALLVQWYDDMRYCLTANDRQQILAGNYPAAVTGLLDALAAQIKGADVIAWFRDAAIARAIDALNAEAAKVVRGATSRTYCRRAGIETTQHGAAFADALARHDAAQAPKSEPPEKTTDEHPAAPAPITTSSGKVLSNEADVIAHVKTIDNVSRLENTARAYGAHPWATDALADVACALINTDTDSARADVLRWAAAGPKAEEVPEALGDFLARVDEIELPGEAVAVWMKHRPALAKLDAAPREVGWKALCKRTEDVGKMKPGSAKTWLRKAIEEEDARRGARMNHGAAA